MPDTSIDTLIRLAADGELSSEQAAQLQAWMQECTSRNPEQAERVRNQMDGERRLRQRCHAVMQDVRVPAGLANQIRQAWTNEANASEANQVESGAEVVGRIGTGNTTIQQTSPAHRRAASNNQRRWMSFFVGPHHANALAVAATLALVVGAVLYGIFGRSIDDVPPPNTVDVISEAALFASQAHDRSSLPSEELQQLCESTCPIDTRADLASRMKCEVGDIPDLRCVGYEYMGWRKLSTPAQLPGPASQLIYRKITDDPTQARAPMVTLTLLPDRQDCGGGVCKDLTDGEWREAAGVTGCHHKVLRSHDRTFVYLLVCCNEADLQAISAKVRQGGGCCARGSKG